jgi:uracil-DNA glycosylase family 4
MVVRRRSTAQPCSACPQVNEPRARWVGGSGPSECPLVIVGEAPGEFEAAVGRPFIGPSGKLLDATLRNHGILRKEVFTTNAVCCPLKPSNAMLDGCRPRLSQEIRDHAPKIILALGKPAFQSLTGSRSALTEYVGTMLWNEEFQAWIMPTWHPAHALRTDAVYPDIDNAIRRCSELLRGQIPFPDKFEKLNFPWTFFRTEAGILKGLRWFGNKAARNGELHVGSDTESVSPGKWPHPEWDEWIMWQIYDDERGAVFDMREGMKYEPVRRLAKKLLKHPCITWYFHNGAIYDSRVFRYNLGCAPADNRFRDTLVLGVGLSERNTAVSLEALSRVYLGVPAFKSALKRHGYRHQRGPQNEQHWKDLARYGVADAYYGLKLGQILPAAVEAEGTTELCEKLLHPLAMTCGRLAARGMIVDTTQFDKLNATWGKRDDELVTELQDLAESVGWPLIPELAKAKDGRLNPRSHPQLSHLMYDVMGLTPTQGLTNRKYRASKWTGKQRERSCDGDFLLGHVDDGGDAGRAAGLVQRIRIYDKLLRTYVAGLEREIGPDGLIHQDYRISTTVTGRLVVRPLLQVLPHYGAHRELSDEDFAAETRRLFPARPGHVIVAADFKQLEMRVAAALSGDQAMIKALEASDPHAITARYMFQREEVDDADRHAAKRVTFGVLYNRSAFTLSRGPLFDVLGGDTKTDNQRQYLAQEFIDSFWRLYHVCHSAQQSWVRTAFDVGELVTPFGRKRRWPLITERNAKEIENQACNFPIQSTASDMCSTALVRLEHAIPRKWGSPMYTVHDQVISEIREAYLDRSLRTINDVMTEPMFDTQGAEFKVTFEVGPNLGDVEKVTV